MKQRLIDFLVRFFAPLVEGSVTISKKVSKEDGELAVKRFTPTPFVRFLYLVFHGTTMSPYENKNGTYRAYKLRIVANLVTTFRLGKPAFVEVVRSNFDRERRPTLEQRWVEGRVPSKEEAQEFLSSLTRVLLDAGLPVWKTTQPNAHLNVRVLDDGRMVCVDYESVVPPLFAGREERQRWKGTWPFFPLDYVDYKLLRREVQQAYQARKWDGTLPHIYSDLENAVNNLWMAISIY